MLDWEQNRSGHRVPRWNGNLLASRADPIREARGWAERHSPLARGVQSIFVLGVGGGFHISELAKQNPKKNIVAIDFVEELVTKFNSSKPPPEISALYFESASRILSNEDVRAALSLSHTICRHAPSIKCAPEEYSEADRLLLGRDPQAFYSQLQARPEDYGFFGRLEFQPVKKRGLVEVHDRVPVTVTQISKSIKQASPHLDDRSMIWLLLSELTR